MSSTCDFLRTLNENGIILAVKDGNVKVQARQGTDNSLLTELKVRSDEVKDYLLNRTPTAGEMLRKALDEINKDYPVGCLDWVRENIPDLYKAAAEVEGQVNNAYVAQDSNRYRQTLVQYVEINGKMIKAFKARDSCQTKGHCLNLTQEADCNLFPIGQGLCKDRVVK